MKNALKYFAIGFTVCLIGFVGYQAQSVVRGGSGNQNGEETSGYSTSKKSGVYAYLSAPSSTTVTTAGTYYPINGIFTNDPIEDFSVTGTPAIVYDGTETQYFNILWGDYVTSDGAGTEIMVGIKLNGEVVTSSLMAQYLKTAGEYYNSSGGTVIELQQGDEVQLIVTSDGDGDVVTFGGFVTSLGEFFD